MTDIVGLGPGDLDRIDESTLALLLDVSRPVVVRTEHHPAARQLAERRSVVFCDDLYESHHGFADVYAAIADRVIAAGSDAVYAVPGSPRVGELAVGEIRRRVAARVHPAESFLDLVFDLVGVDPLADGFRLLNGHELPDVLVFDLPTVIGHLDDPVVLADVAACVDRTAPPELEVTVVVGLGAADGRVWTGHPAGIDPADAGYRTSLYVPAHPAGLVGAVDMMRRLRNECPWDREQTHHSLIRYLVEETYELVEALTSLDATDETDLGAYAEIEDELGDLLLQVLFHSVIAEDAGAFTISDVAHQLRTKMVRRHPHVFGDVDAHDAEAVRRNWDEIKAAERGGEAGSTLDGIPAMPALARAMELGRRAATVGFDWDGAPAVRRSVHVELDELDVAVDARDRSHELGDVLFTLVNLARHLGVEPEAALAGANRRFEDRFRWMESAGDLSALDLDAMDRLWHEAKRRIG